MFGQRTVRNKPDKLPKTLQAKFIVLLAVVMENKDWVSCPWQKFITMKGEHQARSVLWFSVYHELHHGNIFRFHQRVSTCPFISHSCVCDSTRIRHCISVKNLVSINLRLTGSQTQKWWKEKFSKLLLLKSSANCLSNINKSSH